MNKKGPLIAMGIGIGLALLICLISLLLYGEVYFFNGYVITALAWMISIASFVGGVITIIRIPPKLISAAGIFFVIFPWILIFLIPIMPKQLNSYEVAYTIVFMFLGGIALLIYGSILGDNIREENLAKWESLYSDPQWRNDHPKEAAEVEAKKRREHLRWNGKAVSIHNIECGHEMVGYQGVVSWHYTPNHSGGWTIRFKISNNGARTIKYVSITFAAYNAVGDKCYCRIHKRADTLVNYTGPLNPGYTTDYLYFKNAWYDIPLSRISVEHIHVDFMDGKSQDIYKDGKHENHGF